MSFLGAGLLASGMIEAMLKRGRHVTVWNRTAAKARALEHAGAHVVETAAAAAAAAAEVHIVLADDAAVDSVLGSVVGALRPGAIVVDHSTASPAGTSVRLEKAARDGIRLLHAPVFMSPQNARESRGMMMVSGPAEAFEAVRASLETMAADVWYLGERTDLAAAYKIFGNSMIFAMTAGLADVFAMATNLGVRPQDAAGLFERFKVGNVIGFRAEKMSRGDFSASFELTMARKDARLMIDAAGTKPLTLLPVIAKRMDEAIAAGHGKDDLGALAAAVFAAARS